MVLGAQLAVDALVGGVLDVAEEIASAGHKRRHVSLLALAATGLFHVGDRALYRRLQISGALVLCRRRRSCRRPTWVADLVHLVLDLAVEVQVAVGAFNTSFLDVLVSRDDFQRWILALDVHHLAVEQRQVEQSGIGESVVAVVDVLLNIARRRAAVVAVANAPRWRFCRFSSIFEKRTERLADDEELTRFVELALAQSEIGLVRFAFGQRLAIDLEWPMSFEAFRKARLVFFEHFRRQCIVTARIHVRMTEGGRANY